MQNSETQAPVLTICRAIASPVRLLILDWLRDPVANFPAQTDGDLVIDGVCSDFIRDRASLAASTTSRHLAVLVEAGMVVATRKRGWTFYRRDEDAISQFVNDLRTSL